MSNVDNVCEYVCNLTKFETEESDRHRYYPLPEQHSDEQSGEPVWSCIHESAGKVDGEHRCIFHLPLDEKEDDAVVESFLNKIDLVKNKDHVSEYPEELQFIGAELGDFELDFEFSELEANINIGFNLATVSGRLHWRMSGDQNVNVAFPGARIDNEVEFDINNSKNSGNINFDGANLGSDAIFNQVNISGDVVFYNAKIGGDIDLGKSVIKSANFTDTEIGGDVNLDGLNTSEGISFHHSKIDGEIYNGYTISKIGGDFAFDNTTIGGDIHLMAIRVAGDVRFSGTKVSGNVTIRTLSRYVIEGQLIFKNANLLGDFTFEGLKIGDNVNFRAAEIHGDTEFFLRENVGGEAKFHQIEVHGDGIFKKFQAEGTISFQDAKINGKIVFSEAKLNKANFRKVDLTGVDFTDANLTEANLERGLFNRSTLFKTDLRGAKLNGAVFGDARIDGETQFLGNPTEEQVSSYTLDGILTRSCIVYDDKYASSKTDKSSWLLSPFLQILYGIQSLFIYIMNLILGKSRDEVFANSNNSSNVGTSDTNDSVESNNEQYQQVADNDKAKSVYQALEELARKSAQSELQSECFIRRQDVQKRGYKTKAQNSATRQIKLIAGARYCRAKVARVTLLYGESPWRVVIGSAGFILFIALLYPFGEWLRPVGSEPITYAQIYENPELFLELLYFSTLTFTTLGMGDYEPIGFGQVLATVNTAFGAILIALLVFVLGRRAAR